MGLREHAIEEYNKNIGPKRFSESWWQEAYEKEEQADAKWFEEAKPVVALAFEHTFGCQPESFTLLRPYIIGFTCDNLNFVARADHFPPSRPGPGGALFSFWLCEMPDWKGRSRQVFNLAQLGKTILALFGETSDES